MPVGCGQATLRITGRDHRRHRRVSDLAHPGRATSSAGRGREKQSRPTWPSGHDLEVRAYDGEVESLSSAHDVGRRRPRAPHRRGRRRPARLRLGRLARRATSSRRPWPRRGTTPRSPRPTRRRLRHARRGGARPSSTCGTPALADVADRRQGRPGHRARAPRPRRDPQIRQVDSADYGDEQRRGGAGLDHRHPGDQPAHGRVPLGVGDRRRGERDPDRHGLQRGPRLRGTRRRRGRRRRHLALDPDARRDQGPVAPASRSSSTRRVASTLLGRRLLRPLRRGGGEGPLVLRRAAGRGGGGAAR